MYHGHNLLNVLLLGLCVVAFSSVFNVKAEDKKQQLLLLAPGYGELDFEAPEAGTYSLPALGVAKDARVLNADGEYVNFHDLFEDKYTLLSFIYTRCNDVNGCPLTHVVFNRIKAIAKKTPGLSEQLQLISMSFDPEHDTPDVLKALSREDHSQHEGHSGHEDHSGHQNHHKADRNEVDWFYLTADSIDSLKPILDDYNQSIQKQIDEDGKQSDNFAHILRVFLIDTEKRIRNIYSVSFLHPDIIINDVKTIRLEAESRADTVKNKEELVRTGPGDAKEGYDSTEYKTDSLSLEARKGRETDLLKVVKNAPLGLPPIPVPEGNPVTEDKVDLGKKLFFDRRLSLNDTTSCAMCHIPEQGFTNNELKTPVGFEGRTVRRNAPTIYNTAYLTRLFHDARETSLENQVWDPLTARNEMAMPSIGLVIEKIRNLPDYSGLFERAFDGEKASIVTIGKAIASYERTLVSGNSPFDRWYFSKEENAISESAKRGFDLFRGKGKCVVCHTVNDDFALFTDNKLHNTGIGWNVSMRKEPETKKVLVAPGQYITVKQDIIDSVGHKPIGDLGHYEITQDPADRWHYRTPSLRNISLTAPYMHDGSLATLEEVVEFYNKGGFKNKLQSPHIKPLELSKEEVNDIVAFLKTLNGDNVQELISDAFTAPIGDKTKSLD